MNEIQKWEKPSLLARIEKGIVTVGKVAFVVAAVGGGLMIWGNRDATEDLNQKVDQLWSAYFSGGKWVAREVAAKKTSSGLLVLPLITLTGKYVCGRPGEKATECTPSVQEKKTRLCVAPWTDAAWGGAPSLKGIPGDHFGTPYLCPDDLIPRPDYLIQGKGKGVPGTP